jgi:hypothetical protein
MFFFCFNFFPQHFQSGDARHGESSVDGEGSVKIAHCNKIGSDENTMLKRNEHLRQLFGLQTKHIQTQKTKHENNESVEKPLILQRQ